MNQENPAPVPNEPQEAKPAVPLSKLNQPVEVDITALFKWIYNCNPFYLISAAVVLYAQTALFKTSDLNLNTLIPMGITAAFTALLAATSIFIVRWGKVWDDARSIFMTVIALLLVLSVSVDSLALDGGALGAAYLAAGLFFALGVIESIRRQLAIRFPRGFLAAFYTILGAFFGYPLIMSRLIIDFPDDRSPAMWGILGFPVLFALLFGLLLPVARLGRRCAEDSNTPWRAPLFPWSAAVMLFGGAVFRSYLLTISFHGARGVGGFDRLESGFGCYMLIPFALAALALAIEYLRAEEVKFSKAALALPLLPILLGLLSGGRAERAFLEFYRLIFSPAFTPMLLGVGAAFAAYAYCWFRGFRHCDIAAAATLLIPVVFPVSALPAVGIISGIGALGIMLRLLIRHNHTLYRIGFGLAGIAIGSMLLRNTAFVMHHGIIPIHLAGLTALVIALFGHDRLALWLRRTGSVCWLLLFFFALLFSPAIVREQDISVAAMAAYLAALWLSGIAYCLICREKLHRALIAGYLVIGSIGLSVFGYVKIRHIPGISIALWALVLFTVAFFISLSKALKHRRK